MKLEKVVQISGIITLSLFIEACISGFVCLVIYKGDNMNEFFQSVGGQITISVVSTMIISLSTLILTAFLFLRKIPEQTRDQVEELLNERLKNETENHNAVMTALNPDTKSLAAEHKELQRTVAQTLEHLHIEKAVREEREKHLTGEQKSIDMHIEALRSFADVMAKQQVQISQLQEHIHSLEQQNTKLREQLELTQEQDEDFEMRMQ